LGLKWLLIGVGYGAIGLASVFYAPFARLLCAVFTRWFNSEFWWFFLSDVSMYYLYKYYMASHVPAKTSSSHVTYDSDYESDEESDEEVQRLIKPRTPATTFRPVVQQQQQQQIVYIPMPYYNTTPTTAYYAPQTAPVYY